MQNSVIPKLSWRLKELPAATGLSLPFWRKVVRLNKIEVQEVEGAIVIMDDVLREFLTRKKKVATEPQTASVAAQ